MHLPDFLKEDWMKDIEIRLTINEDTPVLLEIIHAAYAPLESILGRKPRGLRETDDGLQERIEKKTLYSVLLKDELIATFTLARSRQYELMEISKVAIHPNNQNKGLGTFVMESAEQLVRLMEEKKVYVQTYADNEQLVSFYLHREYKIFRKRVIRGNMIMHMEKKLWRED
ncbi:MAG: GNAT family N-acetyltransferase [Candidatus Heimdallarchaeota archaeon]